MPVVMPVVMIVAEAEPAGRRGAMRKAWMNGAVIGMLVLSGTAYAHGQEATEMFIPVGQSPGLSGKVTVIGAVEAVDAASRTITIAGASGAARAEITDRTDIWLDRSKRSLPNRKGTLADLERGRVVEVKYVDTQLRGQGPARWIKVQLPE